MAERVKFLVLLVSTLIVAYALVGGLLPQVVGQEETYQDLSLFSAVLDHVRRDYVEEPDLNESLRGAIEGMVEALDPYAGFVAAEVYRELQEPGQGDVGLIVSKRYGYAYVVAVTPGSPAEKIGLRTGDLLEAVEGRSTALMSAWEVQRRLRGHEGSEVALKVIRARRSEPQEVSLTRCRIEPRPPEGKLLEEDIGMLRIPSFHKGAAAEAEKAIRDLLERGAKALLIDLRSTAVGSLEEAVHLADAFLPAGETIVELRGKGGERKVLSSSRPPLVEEIPVAILIDGGTSGPAEVFAAALRDHGAATLIGERTDGRGVVVRERVLQDGSLLMLPVEVMVRPSGELISAKELRKAGLEPDVEIPGRDFVSNFYFDHIDDESGDELSDEFYAELDAAVKGEQLREAMSLLREKIENQQGKSLKQAA